MRKSKLRRQRFIAGFLGAALGISLAAPTQIQAKPQEISLEKSAAWESAEDYRAVIRLKASGIEKYTQKEVPLSIIPLLDVTDSMDRCETPGHYHKVFSHWVSAFEGAAQLWKDSIMPVLPTPEEYAQMGQENADAMLLKLPPDLDPDGRCRLVYQKGRSEQKDYYSLFNWRVFYVTDGDETPLYALREGQEMNDDYSHTFFSDSEGAYLPVGAAQEVGGYIAWTYISDKESGHACEYSRMDQLKEGYAQFIESLFENSGMRVCPVAFVGGYYINGWTGDAQEAVDFIVQESYLEKEPVMPDYNCGTNYEAALAGAMDAAGRLENKENTYAILFTDGVASSGYDHASGEADLGRLDPHSYEMPDHDKSWYPVFADWAVQDAQMLKESIPVYSVGYGSALNQGNAMEILQKISSGGEYFIDTRSTSIQTVADIFRVIYSDLIYKATKVHIVDYISEFWEIEEEKLPEGCSVEQVFILNQNGQPDTISKITYPITREMGADDEEEIVLPIVLREAYRKTAEKTLYETNQDDPLCKDQEGAGAYLEYVDLDGNEQRVYAETPRLDIYPEEPEPTPTEPPVSDNTVSDNDKPPVSDNTISDNDKPPVPDDTVGDNTKPPVSISTVSGNTKPPVSENAVSQNTVSENSISKNTISKNTLSENTISGNTELPVSDNQISENILSSNHEQQILRRNYASATQTPSPSASQKGTSEAASIPRTTGSTGASGTSGTSGTTTSTGADGKGALASSSPKTGDTTPLFGWISLAGLAGALAAALCYRRFRRNIPRKNSSR